jgi:hypothetical protein
MVTAIITGHSDSIGHRIIETQAQDARNCYCDPVTEKGARYLYSIEKVSPSQSPVTGSVTGTVSQPPEAITTVASQADLIRDMGQRLGVGMNNRPFCEMMDLGESFGGSLSHSRAVV